MPPIFNVSWFFVQYQRKGIYTYGVSSRKITLIRIDKELQINYRLVNPITYELYIINQGDEYSAYLKHRYGDVWINNTFNQVLNDGGIYHMMCYPNI